MTSGTEQTSHRVEKPRYFDAHNHLQDESLILHRDSIFQQLNALPMETAVVNGTCEQDWPEVAGLAKKFSWIRPSFGLHPWQVGNRNSNWWEQLVSQLDENPRAALGEIGLDRWILDRASPDDPRLHGLRRAPLAEQHAIFVRQFALGAARNLPVTVHCLDAWGALQTILGETAIPDRGFLLHAYGGSLEIARAMFDRGAYFSFNGYFLDDRQSRARKVFQELPLNRLLVETDAPSMSLPTPWRTYKLPPAPDGTAINHPGNIEAAYAGLAALRGISVPDLSIVVEENFQRFFS